MSTEELDKLSDEELEQLLEKRRKAKQREELARRKKYEQDREQLVANLCSTATDLNTHLAQFKKGCLEAIEEFAHRMLQYGDVSSNSKGGFSLENGDGTLKVKFSNQTKKGFDERADMAEEKLKIFLERFVKARNKQTYKLVISLLERTHNGEFDDKLIMKLWNMENDFDDEDWREAIRLFKESYNPKATTKYMNFYRRNDQGAWELINLNFASVRV